MVTLHRNEADEWAFLLHRLPRVPSGPRITLWRALRRLGAVLVGDGVVALPATPRTIEHLEWLAAGIEESGGEGSVFICRPTTRRTAQRLARQATESVDGEYRAVLREALGATRLDTAERARVQRRLRRQLHAIGSRDFFASRYADQARNAVESLVRSAVSV